MYLACSSESYVKELDAGRLTLDDWLRLAAEELGLKAVELEDKHVGSPTPQRLAAVRAAADRYGLRSEEHTSELQSLAYLVCRLLLEKKKKKMITYVDWLVK